MEKEINIEKEFDNFIKNNGLSIFNTTKTPTKQKNRSIFKTPDARKIHRKVLNIISDYFVFPETSNIFNSLEFTQDPEEIKKRQSFFNKIKNHQAVSNNSFLNELKKPSKTWTPDYDVVVVTEDSETFNKLKEKGCPAQLILSETDLQALEDRDIVQVLDCSEYSMALEQLPQSVFLSSINEAYLERYLEKISAWKENLELLNQQNFAEGKLKKLIDELYPLLSLIDESKQKQGLSYDGVRDKIQEINEKINSRAKDLSVSGESLVEMLNKGQLPKELKDIVYDEIRNSEIPEQVVNIQIPLSIDEEALDQAIRKQESEKNSSMAEKIKSNSETLKDIPGKLAELERLLLIYDFMSGVKQFSQDKNTFPNVSSKETREELIIENSENLFLEKPKPISFHLNENEKASILTGANSGGKTTLMEHIIQIISLKQMGLPVKVEINQENQGQIKLPLFTEIYYFAKNKGDISKGAFENLLDQMSKIKTSSGLDASQEPEGNK
ncbi:MAG TPA: hypothetical protein VJ912_01730, partial [Candidatus Nanoarchaeia archaeon]|nr:hypothetical protein [Candidatus Nanoarchaeia archaeon]